MQIPHQPPNEVNTYTATKRLSPVTVLYMARLTVHNALSPSMEPHSYKPVALVKWSCTGAIHVGMALRLSIHNSRTAICFAAGKVTAFHLEPE